MSILINNTEDTGPQARFTFQYFDQECDFGVENENGERVRKRKRPGRKPNPPTVQERRAQNRAAQKAFRQRESQRKEEKERTWKKYSDEIKRLKKELSTTQYEVKYLRACVLHLTLASLIHRGSVPHIWTDAHIIPNNNHGEYNEPKYTHDTQDLANEVDQTPVLLDIMLKNNEIVAFDDAVVKTALPPEGSQKAPSVLESVFFKRGYDNQILTINKDSQEPRRCFRTSTTYKRPHSPSPEPMTPPPPTVDPKHQTFPEEPVSSPSEVFPDMGGSTQLVATQQQPMMGVLLEPPTLKTADDLALMPTLQALHILRLQLKLGSILGELIPIALFPTALQRVIPHDIRIDYVPSGFIRDRMIIFRDYYDIDECFNYLTRDTVFMGGDVRDVRNWYIGPEYSMKFWFLSHQLIDLCDKNYCLGMLSQTAIKNITKDTLNESTIPITS